MHLSLSLDVPHLWLWEKDELHIRKTLYYHHLHCMIYECTLLAPWTEKKKADRKGLSEFHQVALQMFFMFVSHRSAQAGACCLSEPYKPGMPIFGALLKMICRCCWGLWMALLSYDGGRKGEGFAKTLQHLQLNDLCMPKCKGPQQRATDSRRTAALPLGAAVTKAHHLMLWWDASL